MATIVDGKKLAEEVLNQLCQERGEINLPIQLVAVQAGDNPASIHYLKKKHEAATKIGISFEVKQFPEIVSTALLKEEVLKLSRNQKNTGIIVQLPLPKNVETNTVLDAVPQEKDVDVLSEKSFGAFVDGHSKILPPVIGAIEYILNYYNINPKGKFVVIVGTGPLVGIPSAIWFSFQGAVTCFSGKDEGRLRQFVSQADILVTGGGRPHSIKGEMLKEGVVVLDAGYEIVDGKPTGDVDFESALPKASLITPVPGGIGPLTVAMLMRNLLTLAKLQQ